MKRLRPFMLRSALLCASLGFIVAAKADVASTTNDRVVAVRTTLKLAHYASINADCTSRGKTVVRVTSAPQHGSILSRVSSDFAHFSPVGDWAHCNSQRVLGTAVFYRPQRDFVGADSTVLDVIYPNGLERSETFNITVK